MIGPKPNTKALTSQHTSQTLLNVSVVAGCFAWCALLFISISDSRETELIQRILLLGILVVVPLGLSLIVAPRERRPSVWFRFAVFAQPFGAAASVAAFLFEQGTIAGLLAAAWLVTNILIAVFALSRILNRGPLPLEEMSIDAGLAYLPVGGVWFLCSRLGLQPLGFGDTIVLLTAIHFHFAGFAAPVIAGLTGRVISSERPRRAFALAAGAIVIAMPIVAAGITFSPAFALIGAVIISAGLTLLSVLMFTFVGRATIPLAARILLVLSGLSTLIAMTLACLYAYSIIAHTVIFDIPTMAASHGILNSFGFSLCGLAGWRLIQPPTRAIHRS